MSRWGKNIVVPLDSLIKEKENTNRPTAARSAGTVGKWGKMGFTSTRTYALQSLPTATAIVTSPAASILSPGQSPDATGSTGGTGLDDDLSPAVPEPPKPKKFFKSRNTNPDLITAQTIHHLPRAPPSPIRDGSSSYAASVSTPQRREPIKLKIPKTNSAERKKSQAAACGTNTNALAVERDIKPKKKKEEKKLKPEAPPSRIISRCRKVVNYKEFDEEDRSPTPLKDLILSKPQATKTTQQTDPSPPPPPPAIPSQSSSVILQPPMSIVPKTPEHPPIVLRISKGTSRLVSTDTDGEEQINSPQHDIQNLSNASNYHISSAPSVPLYSEPHKASTTIQPDQVGDVHAVIPNASIVQTTPKIIVKLPVPPAETVPVVETATENYDPPEINYCTVKISPDKPPKERLKLIIKTDVIRNALAAAAAAAAAKAASAAMNNAASATSAALDATGSGSEKPEKHEKEKKSKSKKHKHLRNIEASSTVEFKMPSPQLALGGVVEQQPYRTVISPPALSERDFDSQSSVLGSISSKGNSTPQLLAQAIPEESCVIRSRGSSDITSDLETSQHSSLVAPPSDIELRLESMMDGADEMDIEKDVDLPPSIPVEPLEEDIFQVLTGCTPVANGISSIADNKDAVDGTTTGESPKVDEENSPVRRVTRGRKGKPPTEVSPSPPKEQQVATTRRTRKMAEALAVSINTQEEMVVAPQPGKRTTRRQQIAEKAAEVVIPEVPATKEASPCSTLSPDADAAVVAETPANVEDQQAQVEPALQQFRRAEQTTTTITAEEEPPDEPTLLPPRRTGRSTASANATPTTEEPKPELISPIRRGGRVTRNNNHSVSNNNNVNKIAADLSSRATENTAVDDTKLAAPVVPRSYVGGRKRKNPQVTQVLQRNSTQDDLPPPAKIASSDNDGAKSVVQKSLPAGQVLSADLPLGDQPDIAVNDDTCRIQHLDKVNSELHCVTLMDDESLADPQSILNDAQTSPPVPPARRDYKIKDKFKRTWLERDARDQQEAAQAAQVTHVTNNNHNTTTSTIQNMTGSTDPETAAPADDADADKQRTAVKLVISKKKGSIFKSRALIADQGDQNQKRHLYKHRWDEEEERNGKRSASGGPASAGDSSMIDGDNAAQQRTAVDAIFDDFSEDIDDSRESPKLTRVVKLNPNANCYDDDPSSATGGTITSLRCDRKAKDYYTVVRNVKTAHQIQEIGEYQEMDDDVEYILDALQPHNPIPTRCLSALQLATKCMAPAFRMHLRAHGVVTKFFKALSDANTDLSLGLCTSAIMFILSQDALNMDLDRDSLELMMNLLEADVAAPTDMTNFDRNKQKVRELCEEIKSQGKATHLNVDSIAVGTLAMETLLSLTSKRAGEWFKEELRELGGLDHIIKMISDCCRQLCEIEASINWTAALLDNLKTIERCLRVLENVTQMNEENQKYVLTSYAQGNTVNTLCKLYKLCDREISLYPTTDYTSKDNPGVVLREALIPLMKVLINLTHPFDPANALGSSLLGQHAGIFDTSLHILLQAPSYIPDRCVFELSILVLLLLINLTMYTVPNRTIIMKTYAPPEFGTHHHDNIQKLSAIEALTEYFYKCEELARLVEKNTDAILDNKDKNKKKQEEVDETVNNLLQKAGHHMEHTLKGSYAGILIGHLVADSEENETIIRGHLRENGFKEIIGVLEKYYTFMNLTASSEASVVAHIKSTKKLIDCFKKRDLVFEMDKSTDNGRNLDATSSPPTTSSSVSAPATRSTQRVYKTYSQR